MEIIKSLKKFFGKNTLLKGEERETYINNIISGFNSEVNTKNRNIIRLIIEWNESLKPIEELIELLRIIEIDDNERITFPIFFEDIVENEFTCVTSLGEQLKIKLTTSVFTPNRLIRISYNEKKITYIYSNVWTRIKLQEWLIEDYLKGRLDIKEVN